MSARDLEALMLEDLARSGLSARDAEDLRVEPLTPRETQKLTRNKDYRFATYRIPYFRPDGRLIKADNAFRLRSLDPKHGFGKDGDQRYWQPYKSPPRVYFTPGVDWDKALADPRILLTLTEGEKKAIAACRHSIVALGFPGAWSIKSKRLGMEFLPEFDDITLDGRIVEIAYDGDHQTNSKVYAAIRYLAQRLSERSAEARNVLLPPGDKLDDHLVAHGRDSYLALPREPLNPKMVIGCILAGGGNAHVKKQRVADTVQRHVLAIGTAHLVESEPILFNKEERRLYSLLTCDESQLTAFLHDTYGLNAAEPEFRFVYEQLRTHAIRHGTPAEAATFSHLNLDEDPPTLRLALGGTRVVEVTAKGIRNALNGDGGIMFRDTPLEPFRRKGVKPSERAFRGVLDTPNFRGGEILSIAEQEMVWELHFWSLIFPTLMRTRPLALLHGPRDSGKSSAGRAVGIAMFGSAFDVQVVDPNRLDDVDTALINTPLVVLDNLDGPIKGLENRLAVAATGGKIMRRELYTTSQMVEFPLRARIIATSRQPNVFKRDDVRDRTLFLKVDIRKLKMPEEHLIARILAFRDEFWAYVLKHVPAMVGALAKHEPQPRNERLADFAQFCVAVGPVIGYRANDIENALANLERERNAFASKSSALLEGLMLWAFATWKASAWSAPAAKRKAVRIASAELFTQVREHWKRGDFPIHTPESFGLAMRNDESVILTHFTLVRETGHARKTVFTIKPTYRLEPEELARRKERDERDY